MNNLEYVHCTYSMAIISLVSHIIHYTMPGLLSTNYYSIFATHWRSTQRVCLPRAYASPNNKCLY